MVGDSASVSESTVVEAPEKSVGRVEFVSVLRKEGGMRRRLEADLSKEEPWTWVLRDEEEVEGRNGGEGGRHIAHSNGRTCVQSTDLGPCASQKWVSASYKKGDVS